MEKAGDPDGSDQRPSRDGDSSMPETTVVTQKIERKTAQKVKRARKSMVIDFAFENS